MLKKIYFLSVLLLILVLPFTATLSAATFDNLIVFGDSLSDNGNVSRFSNGDIWVGTLANSMGAYLYDYAYGGATTSYDNPAIGSPGTGLLWQVDKTMNSAYGTASYTGSSLVSVWAGANDFLQHRDSANAAANVGLALNSLYTDGFRDFIVPNLPDIGKTPAFLSGDSSLAALASVWTGAYNLALAATLSDFVDMYSDVKVYDLDIYAAFNDYPVGDKNQWTQVGVDGDGNPIMAWLGSDTWGQLFWVDGFHPSSAGHELISGLAASAIPEPATVVLFGLGLLGLACVGRKKAIEA